VRWGNGEGGRGRWRGLSSTMAVLLWQSSSAVQGSCSMRGRGGVGGDGGSNLVRAGVPPTATFGREAKRQGGGR
jgi:hypothetical protein